MADSTPRGFGAQLSRLRQSNPNLTSTDVLGYKPVAPHYGDLDRARTTKLSVAEMLAMRDRGGPTMSTVTDGRTGKVLTANEALERMPEGGYKFTMLPSSGINNRGGGGYRGAGGGGGFRSSQMGPDEAPLRRETSADYIRRNGGLSAPRPSLLNDLYRNQPGKTMGAYDRLQSQKDMDMADPNAAFFADQIGVATGQGDFARAQLMQDLLQDWLAQQQAAGDGGFPTADNVLAPGAPGVSTGFRSTQLQPGEGPGMPGEERRDAGGNLWRWNEETGAGELIERAPSTVDGLLLEREQNRPQTQWNPSDELGEGTLSTPFGNASVEQADTLVTRGPNATFTNGQGSSLGGVNFPGQQGTMSAEEFFQETSNRQGIPNARAVPQPGYGGTRDESFISMASLPKGGLWDTYRTAMETKNKLGKR